MASRLSERERVLLGYAPRDPSGSFPGASPGRNSCDVDFSDVFGGPPRRSSIADLRRSRSRADSMDCGSLRASGSGSGSGYGSGTGSGLGERPVFGETSSPVARRRHLKDDFFSDIFPSGESGCSSPRRLERDSLNSPTGGSRILSPTRQLPPGTVASSLPAQLSLSTKLAKVADSSVGSPSQRTLYKNEDESLDILPSSPTSYMPISAIQARQSPLSRHISHSVNESSEDIHSDCVNANDNSQKEPNSLDSYVSKGLFHFSIYKWAGKGVTLVMPSKQNLHQASRFKRLPEVVVHEVDVVLHEENMSTNNQNESDMEVTVKTKVDAVSTAAEGSKISHGKGAENSGNANIKDVKVPVTSHEAKDRITKNLQQLFHADLKKQAVENKDTITHAGTEDYIRSQQSVPENMNMKQRGNNKNHAKVTSPSTRDTPVTPDEKMRGIRVKGKVKDFMKIFNQDGSPKCKGTFETPGRRSKGKDDGKVTGDDPICMPTTTTDEQVKTNVDSSNSSLSDAPVTMSQSSETAEVDLNKHFDVGMIDDSLSEEKVPLMTIADSVPDFIDVTVCDTEESHYEDLEGCLIEPLLDDQNKDMKSDSDPDQFRKIDAKIREWSRGKEGNIRSLLSTLQYVLWPESGWKPVPLVNIIEGSAVKRSYQRALLYLHPDKVQQKGADAHQKYIAEKVFKIMQEAWDHFSSSSQIF